MDENYPHLRDLTPHVDDRGILVELHRTGWRLMPPLNQVYTVFDRQPGVIRAFHKHDELWDGFVIGFGSAVFNLWTGVKNEMGWVVTETEKYTLDYRKPQLLVIPPGWFHGWSSLEPNTLLISLANNEYNRENPDEVRVDPNNIVGEQFDWEPVAR